MDYEKAYKEALERARELAAKWTGKNKDFYIGDYSYIFPELRESEDERIRKWLVDYFSSIKETVWIHRDITCEQILAYLEKRKEQKHYWKPTDTDVALFSKAVTTNKALTPTERAQLDIIRSKFGCCRAVNCNGIMQKEHKPAEWSEEDKEALDMCLDVIPKKWKTKSGILLTKWLKDNIHLQPKQKWSEEDEHNLNSVISLVHNTSDGAWGSCIGDRIENWLKSLRPNKQK